MLQTGVFFFRYNRVLTESGGSITAPQLLEAGAAKVAADTGIMAPVIEDSQNATQKKRDAAISRFIDQEKLHRMHKQGKNGQGSNAPAASCLPVTESMDV